MGSQAVGAGDMVRFGRIMRGSSLVPLGIAAAAALLSIPISRPLMHAMLGGAAIAPAAASYLVVRCASLIPIGVSEIAITAFSAAGDTAIALRLLVVINLVHIPLLLALALGLGTHHPLGLVGAGISSLISELVGAAYCVTQLLRRPELHVFAGRDFDLKIARANLALGWPEFVFLVLVIVPEPLTVALLAPLGVTAVAAFRALGIVSDLSWALPGSLGQAAQIVVGQRIGAGDVPGARAFARDAIRYSTIACVVVGAVTASARAAHLAAVHAERHARCDRGRAAGRAHGDAAAQRLLDGRARPNPRRRRHALHDVDGPDLRRPVDRAAMVRHRDLAPRAVGGAARMDRRLERTLARDLAALRNRRLDDAPPGSVGALMKIAAVRTEGRMR